MADQLPPPRYFRCQAAECGRKWHRISMEIAAGTRASTGSTLFDHSVPREENACPACGAPCEREPGFVYGDRPPPGFEIKTADNAKWSYSE